MKKDVHHRAFAYEFRPRPYFVFIFQTDPLPDSPAAATGVETEHLKQKGGDYVN